MKSVLSLLAVLVGMASNQSVFGSGWPGGIGGVWPSEGWEYSVVEVTRQWGDSIFLNSNAEIAVFLVATDIHAEDLTVVLEEQGGAECDVSLSQMSDGLVGVSVSLVVETDSSGCNLKLEEAATGRQLSGESFVGINY